MDKLTDLAAKMRAASAQPQWHYLQSPLTSTSWDGDSYSTTAKTLIDLSAVFGVPAGARAVLVEMAARDSASATFAAFFRLAPNDIANETAIQIFLEGHPNDKFMAETGVCPCNSDGDIYYQTGASGSGTLDVYLRIWGYLI